MQVDVRVNRGRFRLGLLGGSAPFAEFFHLSKRNNPGANDVTNLAAAAQPACGSSAIGKPERTFAPTLSF